jgi:uncharacterized protein (TIGR02145 family)
VTVQAGIIIGESVEYGSETYETVIIGSQTWFKRNLNYEVEGSKCYGNDNANCDKYGKLYDWATAMKLPRCNDRSCAEQVKAKHQGICPSGWHIPSNADWNILMKFVNPGCSDNSNCAGAGKKLKATSGWNSNRNGTDNYGFSAMPGGYGLSGNFHDVGDVGRWWSASEDNRDAYLRIMSDEYVRYNYFDKGFLQSVRCVKD